MLAPSRHDTLGIAAARLLTPDELRTTYVGTIAARHLRYSRCAATVLTPDTGRCAGLHPGLLRVDPYGVKILPTLRLKTIPCTCGRASF